MKKIDFDRTSIWILCTALWLLGLYWMNSSHKASVQKSLSEIEANLNDPSAPPIISPMMRDPKWSVAYWIDVNNESSDCKMADEIMDKGGNVKIIRHGAVSKEYFLADYISSCQNRIKRALDLVEKPAHKWCVFKNTDELLARLCKEWTDNKDSYILKMQSHDMPTLKRYESYPNK